ncbi:MAG TPA: thiamine pyrophosphate-binding protein [Jatrophihabitans sp.]|uniref:thiamine pyrophosphate-binding protein n=1 Tax=Jatrophihabitans sp. TaxID=1932789 RepID=UPI002EFAC3EE
MPGLHPSHAVLALIGRVDGTARLLLTTRSAELRAFPGDIALPGGRCEPGESPAQTVLREAFEEVGLEPETVEVLGESPLIRLPENDDLIVAVYARWRKPHPLKSSAEVADPLLVPVAVLLDESTHRRAVAEDGRAAVAWRLPGGGVIWGLTALVVQLLLEEMAPGWSGSRDLDQLPAIDPVTGAEAQPARATGRIPAPAAGRIPAQARTGADLLCAQLTAEGITEVMTLTGGHISPIFQGCAQQGIRLIDFRHEAAAVHAADALARLRRRPQVAAVTAGPGLTNSVTAIANAWYAQSPVVLLSGRNPVLLEGLGGLQDAPHVELLRPITKRAETAMDGSRLAELTEWAFTAAQAPRSGPVLLDLPLDVQLTPVTDGVLPGCRRFTSAPGPDPDEVAAVARLIGSATRPVLLAGSGAYWSAAADSLTELAQTLGAPTYCNGLARGMLPPDHPSALRFSRSEALRSADVVLVLGADFDFRLGYGRPPVFGDDVAVVHVDPDASRIGHARDVRHGVVSDIRLFLEALNRLGHSFARRVEPDWLTELRACDDRRRAASQQAIELDQVPIHPLRFIAELARFADPDATLIVDGGDIASMAASALAPNAPGRWLDTGPFGCLGVGIPFAMAARLAHPDNQVLAVLGDGAFGFNGMELDSAVRQSLPFVAAIGNDGAWGEMRTFHETMYGAENMQAQYLSQGTRYDRVSEALGGYGERVELPDQIAGALRRAADSNLPAVIDVVLDPSYRHRGATSAAAASLMPAAALAEPGPAGPQQRGG